MDGDAPRSRRKPLTIVAGAVVATLLIAGATIATRPRGVEAVARLLADEGAFDTTTKASENFARVSDMLRVSSERCGRELSATAEPCASQNAAAAWAQVFAFRARGCTQRSIAQARFDLHRHLVSLVEGGEAQRNDTDLPLLPDC